MTFEERPYVVEFPESWQVERPDRSSRQGGIGNDTWNAVDFRVFGQDSDMEVWIELKSFDRLTVDLESFRKELQNIRESLKVKFLGTSALLLHYGKEIQESVRYEIVIDFPDGFPLDKRKVWERAVVSSIYDPNLAGRLSVRVSTVEEFCQQYPAVRVTTEP